MHLIYMDDSKDETHLAFSALCIPDDKWQASLEHLIEMRRALRASDGIYTTVEMHATDWIGGRGNIAPHSIPKGARARMFDYALSSFVLFPSASLLNAFGPVGSEETLFERLLNRIQVFLGKAGSRGVIFSDEGKNYDHLLRRMRRFNFIPSKFGDWGDGAAARNMPTRHILEDIVYRDSKRSLFVQAADFCAFALLRSERPTPATKRLGIDQSFSIVAPLCIRQAFAKDPRRLGIIRT